VPFSVNLTSCAPSSTFSWTGNGTSGGGSILINSIINNTSDSTATTYVVKADNNGCESDPLNVVVNTFPNPIANFTTSPNPPMSNSLTSFIDNSQVPASNIVSRLWTFHDNTTSLDEVATYVYPNPGTYNVCLAIQTSEGCVDTLCKLIEVVAANLTLPNIITPNGDGLNDLLIIPNLQYFESNTVTIFNRWGKKLLDAPDYDNTWDGSNYNDGTYYYIVTTSDGKSYKSFLTILRD